MKKKIISLLLMVTMSATLFACGSVDGKSSQNSEKSTSKESSMSDKSGKTPVKMAAVVFDHVHYQNIKVCAFIVTKNKSLGESINRCVSRGVTSWSDWGEFSHQEENIHMIVISKKTVRSSLIFGVNNKNHFLKR